MKFPKLRHAGLCNILIFLPALFLFFAIGFNIPLANWGTPKWVLALNFLLGCAVSLGYLILGAFPLLYADQVFFLLREGSAPAWNTARAGTAAGAAPYRRRSYAAAAAGVSPSRGRRASLPFIATAAAWARGSIPPSAGGLRSAPCRIWMRTHCGAAGRRPGSPLGAHRSRGHPF